MSAIRYRREIDGLRSVALLPVILFHAGFQLFSGGYIGVDVFFVISGYLITSIILAEKEAGTFTLQKFYERRMRRILPALFCVMLVCLPFAWAWLVPKDLKDFSESVSAVSITLGEPVAPGGRHSVISVSLGVSQPTSPSNPSGKARAGAGSRSNSGIIIFLRSIATRSPVLPCTPIPNRAKASWRAFT